MKSQNLIYPLFFVLFLMASCSKSTFEEQSPIDTKDYTIVQSGKWREYQYDSIVYRGFKRDTFSGYLRVETGEQFVNVTGDTLFKQLVYWKADSSSAYALYRVESIRFDNKELVESRDGLQFVTLKQPLTKGFKWNAHTYFNNSEPIIEVVKGEPLEIYNVQDSWVTEVMDVNVPYENYQETVQLNLVNSITGIEHKYTTEVYAKNIGLVNRNMTILFRESTTNNPLPQDATKGFIADIRLINHN